VKLAARMAALHMKLVKEVMVRCLRKCWAVFLAVELATRGVKDERNWAQKPYPVHVGFPSGLVVS